MTNTELEKRYLEKKAEYERVQREYERFGLSPTYEELSDAVALINKMTELEKKLNDAFLEYTKAELAYTFGIDV